MSTKEWYKPTNEGIGPFDISYIEEFELSPERTEQELKSKNPVTYVIRKNFFRQKDFQKKQRAPRAKKSKKIVQQNPAPNSTQNLQTKVF